MNLGERLPDRLDWLAENDVAMVTVLLLAIYAVYLGLGAAMGFDLSGQLNNLTTLTFFIGVFSLLSLALNLHWGYTGLFNIGVVGFMGVGIYVTAVVSKAPMFESGSALSGAVGGFGLPLWAGIIVGSLAAGVVGLVVAIPALRLRADYLAIVTIAISEILRFTFKEPQLEEMTVGGYVIGLGGGDGLQLDWGSEVELLFNALFLGGLYDGLLAALDETVRSPKAALNGVVYGAILLVFVGLYYLLLQRMGKSPFGRVLKAIREDEDAASSLGKNTGRFKMIAFVVGCSLMGLAGILWFANRGAINATQFRPRLTFYVWIALIIGGAGSNTGSVVGGAVFAAVLFRGPRFLQDVLEQYIDLRALAPDSFGQAVAPITQSFDVVPFLLYTASNITDLQLLIMGFVLIYLMHNRPDGFLGHRKEEAAAISLGQPPGGTAAGAPGTASDSGGSSDGGGERE
jgi:branched-chain amino acid transport system permease protein